MKLLVAEQVATGPMIIQRSLHPCSLLSSQSVIREHFAATVRSRLCSTHRDWVKTSVGAGSPSTNIHFPEWKNS